jgi:hypothetical protein
LCCGRQGCRRRTLPPSVLFWGRRVYWGAVLLVVTTLRQQRSAGLSARRLGVLFGVTRQTLVRWLAYFRDVFPHSQSWQRLRSRCMPAVAPETIPGAVLERLSLVRDGPESSLVKCLRLLRVGAI